MAKLDTMKPSAGEGTGKVKRERKEQLSSSNGQDGILFTKILQVQNKRYYFDVKEHEYGRFVKLAETSQSGSKSRLVIPMYLIPEFEEQLTTILTHLEGLSEFQKVDKGAAGDTVPENKKHMQESEVATELKSGLVEKGRRHYYFNLKENTRGRYLRIKAIGDIAQNLPGFRYYRNRYQKSDDNGRQAPHPRAIIIPESGIVQFKATIEKLWADYGVDIDTDKVALADKQIQLNGTTNEKLPLSARLSSKEFRKVIFLDCGENSRGTFCRFTEQQNHHRESITVPSSHFKEIGEWFLKAAQMVRVEEEEADSADSNSENRPPVDRRRDAASGSDEE